ncbi:hypothetical protein GGP41_000498 [Bipolaris sorokiniana]|nr:hypothetical protein GGP41_000498 [Bipolaris sorokiniana]
MFEYEAPIKEVERTEITALTTSKDKINLELFTGRSENAVLQEKIEEKEKHRDILLHMVKRLTEALSLPKANTEGAGEHAGAETNPNNANHLHGLPNASALSYLPANPDQPSFSNPPPTQHTHWTQQLYTPKEERGVLTAKLRIVEREREQYLRQYKMLRAQNHERRTEEQLRQYRSFMSHKHKECNKQSGDGVQEGKVKKEKGDLKLKRRKHKEKDRLNREVTEAFLKRLEFNLVICEKSNGKSE